MNLEAKFGEDLVHAGDRPSKQESGPRHDDEVAGVKVTPTRMGPCPGYRLRFIRD